MGDTILPLKASGRITNPEMVWLRISTYLNAYVLTFVTDQGWYFSTSTNLLTWTTPMNFMPARMWVDCQPMDWNYIFVNPENLGGVIGQTGYVVYAHTDSKGLEAPTAFRHTNCGSARSPSRKIPDLNGNVTTLFCSGIVRVGLHLPS